MPNPTTIIELEGLTLSELIQLHEEIQSQLFTKLALDADVASEVGALQNLQRVLAQRQTTKRQV